MFLQVRLNAVAYKKNQTSSLFDCGESNEEDPKIVMWKKTFDFFMFMIKASYIKKLPSSIHICGDKYEKTIKFGFGRQHQNNSKFFSMFLLVR